MGNLLQRFGHVRRQVWLRHQQFGVSLDDGEDVVEVVSDARRQLAHGLHFLRLAQLRFEVEPVGHIKRVTLHDLADQDGEERPGKRPAVLVDFHVGPAAARLQAALDDVREIGWQDLARIAFTQRACHLLGGVVEVRQRPVGGQFQHWIGIVKRECGQLLNFPLRQFPFRDVAIV